MEETFYSHSISLMSEETSNLATKAQLTMELEKVSNLKANVTALYQEGEKLCTDCIPVKFNIILTGFRARLVIADVMLNQLEMNTYATTNHNTLLAVPDNKGGDDRNEVDNSSTNKTDQYIRTLVAEMRQLRDYVASVAEVASIKNDDCYSDDGYSDDYYSDDYYSDGEVPDRGGGDVSNELLINPVLD